MIGKDPDKVLGLTPQVLAFQEEAASGSFQRLKTWNGKDGLCELLLGRDALWVLLKQTGGGGTALRTAFSPSGTLTLKKTQEQENGLTAALSSPVGDFEVRLDIALTPRLQVRAVVQLTPAHDLLLPYVERDLLPIDAENSPLGTEGKFHAAQRGLNGGMLYFSMTEPEAGSFLYFQNFTSLHPYFETTETLPDGCVGGDWPSLGCLLPSQPDRPLEAGKPFILSDALLTFDPSLPKDERDSARLFLEMLAKTYEKIERPQTQYHDWPRMAAKTLEDLARSPKATLQHYGHTYLHPYTDSEYPDSMVQLTVLLAVREFAFWRGREAVLVEKLWKGFPKFFDAELGAVRRYLPNVGSDKDADEVDSWYLYHPLVNLGRLAQEGVEGARELFLKGVEFGIRVAQHFKYVWPIQYKIKTLEVVKQERKPGDPGQSDVGGLYAHVMVQAWELTEDKRYLEEAKRGIEALKDMAFEMAYQMNITGWGALACMRLWRITGEDFYRDESYVFLANFFHNAVLWDSNLKAAKYYSVFMGETCLHDGPYLALYECYESYCAFYEYLQRGQGELPEAVRLLVSEFCKYTLNRAWFFYPSELPEEILAKEIRNGHIDRGLAFPLEDLYAGGDPPGQVGQEIYGSGAAFALTTRAYRKSPQMPFLVFSEYPVQTWEAEANQVLFRLCGQTGFSCRVRLISEGTTLPSKVTIRRVEQGSSPMIGHLTPEGHREFIVSAGALLELCWEETNEKGAA